MNQKFNVKLPLGSALIVGAGSHRKELCWLDRYTAKDFCLRETLSTQIGVLEAKEMLEDYTAKFPIPNSLDTMTQFFGVTKHYPREKDLRSYEFAEELIRKAQAKRLRKQKAKGLQ